LRVITGPIGKKDSGLHLRRYRVQVALTRVILDMHMMQRRVLSIAVCVQRIEATPTIHGTSAHQATPTTTTRRTRLGAVRLA